MHRVGWILTLPALILAVGAGWSGVRAQQQDSDGASPDPLEQTFGKPVFMLTDDEAVALRQARLSAAGRAARTGPESDASADGGAGGDAAQDVPPPLEPVYLAGILYTGAENWTIWLDGERLTAGQRHPAFTIRRIGPTRVRVQWEPERRDESFIFTLAPRQSFDPGAGTVVDGRVRRATVADTGERDGSDRAGPSDP